MPVFNQSRSRVIRIIFALVFVVIIVQLVHLQIFSPGLKISGYNNAIYRKVVYPDRGIIYDRKHRAILENTKMFDLVVTPIEAKGIDTAALCELLNIDTAVYKKRIREIIIKNTAVRPTVFEPLLTPELYAKLNENMYKFPGYVLQERSVRSYPYSTAANVLGYIGEVDTSFLKKHKEDGYEMGDYTGITGLERTYEKELTGQRGIKRYLRDNRSRLQGSYENGVYDTAEIAGKSLYLSLDVELQQLGEKLMTNKVGSIVAIDPRTGGILCMVSSPTYDPNYLTGHDRRKHYGALALDPRLPLINRTANSKYSPGSTFKTIVGIIGLTEGVITDKSTVYCPGAFYCGNRRMGCLDPGTFQIRGAIAHSCNTYFATVYKRILDQPRYGLPDSALKVFNGYAYSFGLGKRLGMDVPTEKFGNIPVSSHYVKIFGKKWNSCNIISNAIGQGEVETTLAQLANVMATLANKGWYYTPHLVDSIEGSTAEDTTLARFKVKHYTDKRIPDSIFEIVHDGMQGVMEYGTGAAAKVPGVVVCGKTGTVENYYKGVKQKDHAFFGAFAPRDNPRIAIAVICENAGFGASSSAPIASLMIEKYLKDSISGQERKNRVEELAKTNLIPARMKKEMERLDSLKQARLRQIDIPEPEASDSTNTDEEDMQPTPTDKQKNKPKKDTSNQTSNGVAILTNNEKKYSTKKYVRTEA